MISKKQKEIINDNLRAYESHFKPLCIKKEDFGKGFYVFEVGNESYIQYCYNIDYLNGWLYGAVQSKCKRMSEKES